MFSLYFILFNVFLLLSSEENKREFQDFSYLRITSTINIILGGLIFFLPTTSLSTPYTELELIVYVGYNILYSLIIFIPRIFTTGLIFIFLGLKYKEQIGQFLMYTGIFWTIYSTWASICLYNPELANPGIVSVLDLLGIIDLGRFYGVMLNILSIGSITNIIAIIFFMVHSYSNNDKNLKIAGFIYLIGQALMGLSLIPFYLSLWL